MICFSASSFRCYAFEAFADVFFPCDVLCVSDPISIRLWKNGARVASGLIIHNFCTFFVSVNVKVPRFALATFSNHGNYTSR